MKSRVLEIFIIEKDWDPFVMDKNDPQRYDDDFIEAGSWHSRTRTTEIPTKWISSDKHSWIIKDKYKSDFDNKVQECLDNNNYNENYENYYTTYMSK